MLKTGGIMAFLRCCDGDENGGGENRVCKTLTQGGIAPNQVIARSEFEVHRQMFTE